MEENELDYVSIIAEALSSLEKECTTRELVNILQLIQEEVQERLLKANDTLIDEEFH